MIKAKFGDRLDGWIEAAAPGLVRHAVNPNLLTVAGTLISLGSATAFAFGRLGLGAWLILAGGLFDLVDGVIARRHGTATVFGAFLDSTMDRLSDMAILLGVMLHFAGRGDAGTVLLAGVALISAVLTSYAKARAEQWVQSFEGGLLERGERLFILGVGAVSGYLVAALWILAVLGTATAAYRFALAYRELARLEMRPPPEARETAG
ncbi:CDP-alcohol phosphatidyltransferase family protein [Myxococcota bacterium]|nr:CDP-alcohol phosphatidyltransferase family protein [Myxococcota bacterium]MCZ7616948.1 CDP-alcohol phosphatidyltransferase family protein [Myxococcota bacterium]